MARLLAAAVLAALVVTGCGDNADQSETTALTETTVVPVPTATTPTVTGAATTSPSTVTTSTEQTTGAGESDQGDEEGTRVPAAFTITGGGSAIRPPVITVPAFFPVELNLRASGGAAQVTFMGPGEPSFSVQDGGTLRSEVGALEPGSYVLRTSSGATATIRSVRGGDVGP